MTQRILVWSLAGLGVAMIVLGSTWKWLNPPASYWSQEQAREYSAAHKAAHAAQDAAAHGQADANDVEYAAARARFEKIQGDLDRVRTARDVTGKYLSITGLILLLAAILLRHFSGRPVDSSK